MLQCWGLPSVSAQVSAAGFAENICNLLPRSGWHLPGTQLIFRKISVKFVKLDKVRLTEQGWSLFLAEMSEDKDDRKSARCYEKSTILWDCFYWSLLNSCVIKTSNLLSNDFRDISYQVSWWLLIWPSAGRRMTRWRLWKTWSHSGFREMRTFSPSIITTSDSKNMLTRNEWMMRSHETIKVFSNNDGGWFMIDRDADACSHGDRSLWPPGPLSSGCAFSSSSSPLRPCHGSTGGGSSAQPPDNWQSTEC